MVSDPVQQFVDLHAKDSIFLKIEHQYLVIIKMQQTGLFYVLKVGITSSPTFYLGEKKICSGLWTSQQKFHVCF